MTSIERLTPSSSPTNSDTLTWQVTFSEDVMGVNAEDFVLAGANAVTLSVSTVTASTVFNVTASGGDLATLNRRVTLYFTTHQNITDTANNALANTSPTGTSERTYVVDNAPTVTIFSVPLTSTGPFTARFIFSEAVTGFTVGDITLTNATALASSFVTLNSSVYTVLITPTTNGALTVDVAADVVMDATGNYNTAAVRASSTYDPSATVAGICGRTEPVRAEILAAIDDISVCDHVTSAHLSTVGPPDSLSLNNMYITTLAAGDFDGLTSLVTLNLFENQLTSLPSGIFNDLTSLQLLYLNKNALTALPDGVFNNLINLVAMKLQHNELTALPDRVFEPLRNLRRLQLHSNPGADFSPTAVAQPDNGTVPDTGGMVTLDGSGSSGEAWGSYVTYSWALTSPATGVTVEFDNNEIASPTVTIPALAGYTELTFTLTVTGRGAISGTTAGVDTATVRVADGTAPRVASITRQSPTSSPTHADDPTWLVTFNEDVANVDAADFMLSGTTATLTVSTDTASSAYSVMASGGNLDALDGTVTLDFRRRPGHRRHRRPRAREHHADGDQRQHLFGGQHRADGDDLRRSREQQHALHGDVHLLGGRDRLCRDGYRAGQRRRLVVHGFGRRYGVHRCDHAAGDRHGDPGRGGGRGHGFGGQRQHGRRAGHLDLRLNLRSQPRHLRAHGSGAHRDSWPD